MWTSAIIKVQVAADRSAGVADAFVGPQIHLLVFNAAEKPSRSLTDDHHVRFGDPLEARREVRRFADDAALLRLTRADQITTTTNPVAMPTRVCKATGDLSALTAATISSPARTARSASSSWACG